MGEQRLAFGFQHDLQRYRGFCGTGAALAEDRYIMAVIGEEPGVFGHDRFHPADHRRIRIMNERDSHWPPLA